MQLPDTHAVDRWLYRGGRPNRIARLLNDAWARVTAIGLAPGPMSTLEVRGRRSGRTISLPVVVARHDGERYLVSMLGDDASWVRNVRAAGGAATLHRRRREEVRLVEVPVADRPPILRAYLAAAPGARAHISVDPGAPVGAFAQVAAGIPVFRITGR